MIGRPNDWRKRRRRERFIDHGLCTYQLYTYMCTKGGGVGVYYFISAELRRNSKTDCSCTIAEMNYIYACRSYRDGLGSVRPTVLRRQSVEKISSDNRAWFLFCFLAKDHKIRHISSRSVYGIQTTEIFAISPITF